MVLNNSCIFQIIKLTFFYIVEIQSLKFEKFKLISIFKYNSIESTTTLLKTFEA